MGGLTVYTSSWTSRNRFLAMVLFIWGMINFSCILDHTGDDPKLWEDYPEMKATSSFFIMFGAACTLVLLSMESFERIVKFVVVGILVLGGLFHLVAGALYVDEDHGNACQDSAECGMTVFGGLATGGVLWPMLTAWLLAFDLCTRKLQEQRLRIIAFSTLVLLVGIIFLCGVDQYWDNGAPRLGMDEDDYRLMFFGNIIIVVGAGLVLIVVALMQQTDIAVFNFVVSLLMAVGLFLMVCTKGVCNSDFVTCWLIVAAHVYLLGCEAQDGGTLRFIMR